MYEKTTRKDKIKSRDSCFLIYFLMLGSTALYRRGTMIKPRSKLEPCMLPGKRCFPINQHPTQQFQKWLNLIVAVAFILAGIYYFVIYYI